MITPEELIQDLIDFYGYEVDLSYAINVSIQQTPYFPL